jgi:hypothetical protein
VQGNHFPCTPQSKPETAFAFPAFPCIFMLDDSVFFIHSVGSQPQSLRRTGTFGSARPDSRPRLAIIETYACQSSASL